MPGTVTPISAWKQATEAITVDVPSGNTCRALKQGMQAFVKAGVVPNSLLPVVLQSIKSGNTPDFDKIEKDPQKVMDAVRLMDSVCVHIMVEPRVLPCPPQEDVKSEFYDPDFERDEDALYVDQVDITDKVFLFQWACGGTSDLERFREQGDELVVPPHPIKAVRKPTKQPSRSGTRKR